VALAAALRFATIGRQSLWYDEAFTAVHVLRSSLGATLHGVLHTESTPPLYYMLLWVWTRVLGDGAVALRSLSALAGLGTVMVAWAVGNTLSGRRAAIWLAALAATSPLLVWYSQEARAYELFALTAALSFWFFLRARQAPQARPRDLWAWVAFSVLALLTHYFAAFLVAGEAILLLVGPGLRPAAARRHVPAVAAVAVAALALIPLVVTQTGHAQWIGRWALGNRLIAIPQYFLLSPSTRDAPLGHGIVAAAVLPVLAALLLIPRLLPGERRVLALCGIVAAFGIGAPIVLVLLGADYLAPRNLIGAWIAAAGALAVIA
jgi:uncharacterized membrane protein